MAGCGDVSTLDLDQGLAFLLSALYLRQSLLLNQHEVTFKKFMTPIHVCHENSEEIQSGTWPRLDRAQSSAADRDGKYSCAP